MKDITVTHGERSLVSAKNPALPNNLPKRPERHNTTIIIAKIISSFNGAQATTSRT